MLMIKEGDAAPGFTLMDKDNEEHALDKVSSRFIILYFYPKDNTPGCTLEAKGFEELLPEFEKLDAKVIGISGGDEQSKEKFCKKQGLKSLLLLADKDFEVSKAYGVYGEKKFMGRTFEGISRTTFILGRDHKVLKAYNKVKPIPHPKEVLEFIKNKVIR